MKDATVQSYSRNGVSPQYSYPKSPEDPLRHKHPSPCNTAVMPIGSTVWYIHLHLVSKSTIHVGVCISYMDTMGYWAVLSDEQMSKGWPFSLLNDEQMSNRVGVKHLPGYIIRGAAKVLLLIPPIVDESLV